MEKEIMALLKFKGIPVNDEEVKEIVIRWLGIQQLKRNQPTETLAVNNIALIHRPGGIAHE